MQIDLEQIDLSFMKQIINKHLTKEQKIMLNNIKTSQIVYGLLKTIADADFDLYIDEQTPAGTNALLIVKGSEVINCLPDFTFGLSILNSDQEYQECLHAYSNNISNYNEYKNGDFDDDINTYLTLVKRYDGFIIAQNIALSPTNTNGLYQIKQLTNFINKYITR